MKHPGTGKPELDSQARLFDLKSRARRAGTRRIALAEAPSTPGPLACMARGPAHCVGSASCSLRAVRAERQQQITAKAERLV